MTISITNPTSTDKKATYNFYTISLNGDTTSITNNISIASVSSTDANSGNYIKITKYPYNGKASHIQHDIFGNMREFIITEMRIYQGVYNGADLELVIEASSPAKDITYVCIPLKTAGSTDISNDLDTTIQSICLSKPDLCPAKLNLNTIIPNQDAGISYLVISGDDKKHIFDSTKQASKMCILVFNNAIPITKDTLTAATTTSIANANINVSSSSGGGEGTGYKFIKKDNISSAKNLSSANIYIDCDGEEGDGAVGNQASGRYKLNEKDIKTIFMAFFIGLILTLTFYACDKLNLEGSVTMFKSIFSGLHNLYDENSVDYKVPIINLNVMVLLIIIVFLACFSLYISSFISKKGRIELLISAIYLNMFLFLLIYVKYLKSVTDKVP